MVNVFIKQILMKIIKLMDFSGALTKMAMDLCEMNFANRNLEKVQ